MPLRSKIEKAGEWRLDELTRFELLLPQESDLSFACICRGAVVLTYAHWEGYFNDATDLLFTELSLGKLALDRMSLGGCCIFAREELDRLSSRSARDDSIVEFLLALEGRMRSYAKLDSKIAKSRSNLDWDRLNFIFSLYGISWLAFEQHRIFIQHQLAGLRHAIAHGTDPTLKREQVKTHLGKGKAVLEEVPLFFDEVQARLLS